MGLVGPVLLRQGPTAKLTSCSVESELDLEKDSQRTRSAGRPVQESPRTRPRSPRTRRIRIITTPISLRGSSQIASLHPRPPNDTLRRKMVSLTLCLLLLFAASAAASLLLQSKISEQFSGVADDYLPLNTAVATIDVFTDRYELDLARLTAAMRDAGLQVIRSHNGGRWSVSARLGC
jgi:hypothetical protein